MITLIVFIHPCSICSNALLFLIQYFYCNGKNCIKVKKKKIVMEILTGFVFNEKYIFISF